MAGAAQSLALAWYLSDLRLPVTVLAALQGSDLLGTLTGVATGAWSVRRFGQRRTLVGALLLEGVVCVVVAIAAFTPGKDVSVGQAYVVAVIAGVVPFATAISSPAWAALVSRWPGTKSDTRQLLLDGVQYQVGGFLGPLFGGLVIGTVMHALQWLSAMNALTNILLAVLVLMLLGFPEPRSIGTHITQKVAIGSLLKYPAIWGMAASSFAAESSRIYLPRIMRQSGENAGTLSIVLALISAAAVLAGIVASRLYLQNHTLAGIALVDLGLGLGVWAFTPFIHPFGWFVGAVIVGTAVGIVHAPLIAMLMEHAGEEQRALGAASGMTVRAIAGAMGGMIFAALVSPLGSLVYLVTSATTLATGMSFAGFNKRSRREEKSR